MRKVLVAALLTTATFASAPAFAQGSADKKMGVGGDLAFVVPIGDFSDLTGPQLGPIGRFGYRVIPQLELTGRLGYLHGFSKTQASVGGVELKTAVSVIPLQIGARYFFFADNPTAGLYAGGELGLNWLIGRADPGEGKTNTRFGISGFAGYVISPELPIDIRASFIHYNLLGKDSTDLPGGQSISENSSLGLGLSVGYTYQL